MPLDRLGEPRRQPREEPRPHALSRPIAGLVVDPSPATRERLCRAARQADRDGCQWFEAADAETARRTLASTEIHLVLADSRCFWHTFPGWAASAGTGRPAPLVVVLSGEDEPYGIQQLLDAGAECCLPKRLPSSLLENELRRLVEQARRKGLLPLPDRPAVPKR